MGGIALEDVLSKIMRLGVLASSILLTCGLVTWLAIPHPQRLPGGSPLQLGFLTLISTPVIAVASSALHSARRGDLVLALTSTLVLLILLLGVALGLG